MGAEPPALVGGTGACCALSVLGVGAAVLVVAVLDEVGAADAKILSKMLLRMVMIATYVPVQDENALPDVVFPLPRIGAGGTSA